MGVRDKGLRELMIYKATAYLICRALLCESERINGMGRL